MESTFKQHPSFSMIQTELNCSMMHIAQKKIDTIQ